MGAILGICCQDKVIKDLKARKKPIFWIFGGPGSGKGTQCARLSEKYQLSHLSSGDLLREEIARQTKLGKQLNELMLKGQLVPREVVMKLLKKAVLKAYGSTKGYLIDGYPRDLIQGRDFQAMIGPCAQIIYIDCSDSTLKERLLKRGETSGRADDNEETIKNRIKIFHEVSEPVITEYASITTKISGENGADAVFNQICAQIEPFLKLD